MPASIHSGEGQATLESFMRADTLMAFDFDGVLAPIVAVGERAQLRARTRELLIGLAGRFPCMVVSGRRLADLAPRLDGIPLRFVFGNFGHEPPVDGHEPSPLVAHWVAELNRYFRSEQGITVEDKGYSVAVHYRRAPNPDRARRLIDEAMGTMHGGRSVNGVMAVMLVPQGGPTKGSTLQAARLRLQCTRAVFVGDDATDEDAFTSAHPVQLLSIRVAPSGPTRAAFCLDDQAGIDALLMRMLATSTP